jgi:hypothetical protein
MESHKSHVPNHQPVYALMFASSELASQWLWLKVTENTLNLFA